jgi:hypothetical protein
MVNHRKKVQKKAEIISIYPPPIEFIFKTRWIIQHGIVAWILFRKENLLGQLTFIEDSKDYEQEG